MFNDLREYIAKAEELGEYRLVEGATAEREIGAISLLVSETPNSPLLLFDKIKGYKPGFRVASNVFNSPKRTALGLGFPLETRGLEMVKAFRNKLSAGIKYIPPVEVASGPIKENVITGDKVDLTQFPAPKWHELDGGPYIGTGSMVIVRDPDEGWVNVACYRVQVHDKTTATIYIAPSHQLDIIEKKYWRQGKSCPVAVSCGQEPMNWLAACWPAPWGVCEYDIAGWWRGKPVEVTKGVTTDLPIPANAEIVLEGEIVPPEVETRVEGPFGEFLGYYATGKSIRPAFRVKSILHRNNPIILGTPPSRFPPVWSLGRHIQRAATVWAELDKHVPGVKGVWTIEDIGAPCMMVISLKQEYPGHAKQTALIASGQELAALYLHYLIVVDDDIDPSDIGQVLWALGTRANPEEAVNIITGQLSGPIDPSISPEKRKLGNTTTSTAIILAVRPYHWMKEYAPSIGVAPQVAQEVRGKWSKLFSTL